MSGSTKKISIGHVWRGDYQIVDSLVPKNIDNSNGWYITTLWNSDEKQGETLKIFIPNKSYWDLSANPPILIGKHKTKEEAVEFHEKTVKELKEGGIYG